eukprot:766421-Hanusia_phi.AAC.9
MVTRTWTPTCRLSHERGGRLWSSLCVRGPESLTPPSPRQSCWDGSPAIDDVTTRARVVDLQPA